jgi:hypothetical protein
LAPRALSLRFSRSILATSIATILSGCWEGTTRGVQATVLAVNGPATISANARGQRLPLVPGARPGKGEIVEATGPSRAAVALLPNLLIQLDRDARLEIIRLAITKDGNETGAAMRGRYAEVRLLKGRMFASQVWGEAIAKFSVMTSHGEFVTTSNALFCLEAGEQKTRVTCVSGLVGFRAREGEADTQIPAGFVGEWSRSGVRLVAAETDARGQEDLQEGLEVEENLRALSGQNRLVLPR